MPLRLGNQPDSLEVWLTPHGDFYEALEAMDPTQTFPVPWDVGSEVYLVFGEDGEPQVRWDAAVSANITSWSVQSDDVDDVLDAGLTTARLWYENGIVNYPLAVGQIVVYG